MKDDIITDQWTEFTTDNSRIVVDEDDNGKFRLDLSAEIFFIQTNRIKGLFRFEIIIDVLVRSFCTSSA